ncbi:MAG: Clp1/GlmU family protein [Desulfurococcaceae archaeon]
MRLGAGEGIKAFGPASIKVSRGRVEVFGKELRTGDELVVHRLKSYPLVALEDSELELRLVNSSQIMSMPSDEPYFEWRDFASSLGSGRVNRVVVLGPIDSGKTSLSLTLLNYFTRAGASPALIDADVGQGFLAPPSFVALGYPIGQALGKRDFAVRCRWFVGDIKPEGRWQTITSMVTRYSELASSEGRRPLVVDTDGWVSSVDALRYKLELILGLEANVVIVLDKSLAGQLKGLEKIGVKVVYLRSPATRKGRDRDERRELRSDRYREHLANAKPLKVSLDDVIFVGMPFLEGEQLAGDLLKMAGVKVLSCRRVADALYVIASGKIPGELPREIFNEYGVREVVVVNEDELSGLYVSLVGQGRGCEALECPAILSKIDHEGRYVIFVTPCEGLKVKVVRCSHYRLTEEFREEKLDVYRYRAGVEAIPHERSQAA